MGLRRVARRGAMLVASVLVAVSMTLLALIHTPWGRGKVKQLIESQADRALNGELHIGSVSGGLFTGLELSDVTLNQGPITTIHADRLSLQYSAIQLARGKSIIIDRLYIRGLTLRGERLPSGSLTLAALLKSRDPSSGGPRRAIEIRALEVEGGSVTFDGPWGPSWAILPRAFSGLTAALTLSTSPKEVALTVRRLSANGASPQFQIQNFAGLLRFTPEGWMVENGALRSTKSSINFNSRIVASGGRRQYDITVLPSAVEFPEIARIFPGVRSIDVSANVALRMTGPDNQLVTAGEVQSNAGSISTRLVLDSTVPGWTGKGTADVTVMDVSKWLPTESRSSITGRAEFDLLLGLGRHFPRGPFSFVGPRAVYLGYEATDVRARGRLTPERAEIAQATGNAYGARFLTRGWMTIASPYRFELTGDAAGVDLRRLPPAVAVPRIPTSLAFRYDARGRFQNPILIGAATFQESMVLGAVVSDGTTGSLDTSASPIRYSATGRVSNLDLTTVGNTLDVASLRTARYAGTVTGAFTLEGEGTSVKDFDLEMTTKDATVSIFGGRLTELNFRGKVQRESLSGSGSAILTEIDPSIATATPDYKGSANGRVALATINLPGIFGAGTPLADLSLRGSVELTKSRAGSTEIAKLDLRGAVEGGALTLEEAVIEGTGISALGKGTIALAGGVSSFTLEAVLDDLNALSPFTPIPLAGAGSVRGSINGPFDNLSVKGHFSGSDLGLAGVKVLTATADFSGQVPGNRPRDAVLDVDLKGAMLTMAGWTANGASAKVAYRGDSIRAELQAGLADGRKIKGSGTLVVHADHNEVHIAEARVDLAGAAWEISRGSAEPTVSWDARSVRVADLLLVATLQPESRVSIAGTLGREQPQGELTVDVTNASLESLGTILPALGAYRGQASGQAIISGTLRRPAIVAGLAVTKGGFRQFTFDSLALNGRWSGEDIEGDVRLDQAAGRWLTIRGTVPSNIFSRVGPSRPVNLAIRSSPIDLAVVQGFTSSVSNVTGVLELDVTAVGESHDPHVTGFVQITDAAFRVAATGASYAKGNSRIAFAPDSVNIERFRLEDDKGDPLELSGSATTHDLRLGEFSIELSANRFEILQNALGDVDLNGVVTISGTPAAPVISGDLAAHRAQLAADALLRYFDRPYATTAQSVEGDPLVAAGVVLTRWWDRASLRLRLQATNNLTFQGDNLRFRDEGAAGLGDVNVTFGGDVTLRKAPGAPLMFQGLLHTDRGTYTFQGRRFTIERDGTIRFIGDGTAPLISISAARLVNGVDIHVRLRGTTSQPELELSSSPALEQSDIISLLLFNVGANELAVEQRETIAIQAAALSSGFVVNPAVSAIGRAFGLDFLQVEPGVDRSGTSLRLTAGRDIWRGLFVTYSREFGAFEYNELTAEYSLTRFLRIKGNLSDAAGARSGSNLYRRIERGGIDLVFFFSY